jgi:hypothetical protein
VKDTDDKLQKDEKKKKKNKKATGEANGSENSKL